MTTRIPDPIGAAFAVVCKDIQVLQPHRVTQAERLASYRQAVLKQRRRGLTWDRIAAAMRDPRIDEPVSKKPRREVFAPAAMGGANGSPAEGRGGRNGGREPPVRHLVLGPLTGQRIS